jgi:hypothetical protein
LYFLESYFDKQKIKYLKYSFISSTLLCVHSIYAIYFLIPIFLTILNFIIIKKKLEILKIMFYYFFLPSTMVYFIVIAVTGFAQTYSGNLNLSFLLNNFYEVLTNSFVPGFKTIFLQSAVLDLKFSFESFWTKMTKGESGIMSTHQITILLVIFFTIFRLILKLLFDKKNLNYLDLNIGIFFLSFLLINKNPWLRVYVPITFFLLFYLLDEMQAFILKFKINNKFKINEISFIILLLLTILITPNNSYEQTKNEIIKINKYKENCTTANKFLSQREIWILINFYPKTCKYEYNPEFRKNVLND